MKKADVKLGATYLTKVAGNLVPVKIDREHRHGGWEGTSQKSGKTIRIKSPQRLRKRLADAEQMRAMHKADQENARLAEERGKSPDGQTASERAMAESTPVVKKACKAAKTTTTKSGRDTGKRGATGAKPKRLSILDAAAKVLGERDPADGPLSCTAMVERMQAKGYWEPRKGGLTPSNTLYSALLREIKTKGEDSRFDKVERGRFALSLKR